MKTINTILLTLGLTGLLFTAIAQDNQPPADNTAPQPPNGPAMPEAPGVA